MNLIRELTLTRKIITSSNYPTKHEFFIHKLRKTQQNMIKNDKRISQNMIREKALKKIEVTLMENKRTHDHIHIQVIHDHNGYTVIFFLGFLFA